ncbi:MAG: ATP-binding cassette domain-containing protein, partial [Pseudomonadota bacterium]|nr:ATP-binding cassette domain-containing protein [Pseudomonadota bacterium]
MPDTREITTAPDDALLRVENLSRSFDVSPPWLNRVIDRQPRQFLKAVDGIDFAIRPGETFSLVGESGCGKSTVARLVVGLYAPSTGRIVFEDRDIGGLSRQEMAPIRRRIQMIFQDPYA